MTEILPQIDVGELGFCTRPDGVSGMSVTALADFCGVDQSAITQLLNKIRDSDPITNDLPKSIKLFAGKEWRLTTNDGKNGLYVIDELCHAVVEYYVFDARKYKGKAIAFDNYRMIAKAGLRVFIWSQTDYSPQVLKPEQLELLERIPAIQRAITQLQALLPVTDFTPPGWDAKTWATLPPQDKRHFRYIFRRRNFRPSNQGIERQALPSANLIEQIKIQQQAEVQHLIGETASDQNLEARKQELLARFWEQDGEL